MNGADGTSEEEVKFRQQAEKERGSINRDIERADTEECPRTDTMQKESVVPTKTSVHHQLALPSNISKFTNQVNKIPTPDFNNVKNLKDFASRLPPSAQKLPWRKIEGGAEDGIKWKWKDTDGNKWEVRAHSMDPSAPVNSNAAKGWIYRVEIKPANVGGKWQLDSSGAFHKSNVTNRNSPLFNEGIANDTHIPLPTGGKRWK